MGNDVSVNDSILLSIKRLIGGIDESYTAFDSELVMHINTAFMVVNQIGVGPKDVFSITGPNETWTEFFNDSDIDVKAVASYIALRVKLLFDPPASGVLNEAVERSIKEYEWRLNVFVEYEEARKKELENQNV